MCPCHWSIHWSLIIVNSFPGRPPPCCCQRTPNLLARTHTYMHIYILYILVENKDPSLGCEGCVNGTAKPNSPTKAPAITVSAPSNYDIGVTALVRSGGTTLNCCTLCGQQFPDPTTAIIHYQFGYRWHNICSPASDKLFATFFVLFVSVGTLTNNPA